MPLPFPRSNLNIASFSYLNIGLSCLILFNCLTQPAFSQRDSDPNFNHFYMGRQQWTVEDNSPVIINRTGTAPGAGMNGALPARPPLPKAGWQGYAPIDNPPAATNAAKSGSAAKHSASGSHAKPGQKGQAGNLTGNKSPSGMQGYKPYATYSNPVNAPSPGADLNTSQHVKGSLLHWARRAPQQQ